MRLGVRVAPFQEAEQGQNSWVLGYVQEQMAQQRDWLPSKLPLTPCFQLLPPSPPHPDFGFFSQTGLMPPLGLQSYFNQIIKDII